MKREPTTIVATAALVASLFASWALAGQARRYESAPGLGSVRVDGTSTAHDWTVTGREIAGHIEFQVDVPEGASPEEIRRAIVANPAVAAQVQIPAASLKGGKKDMDRQMYDALKARSNPQITYRLTDAAVIKDGDGRGSTFLLKTRGELTVAGKSRTLEMPMTVQVVGERQLNVSARTSLKMSDFNVRRPQALAGLIKAGDMVKVEVQWVVTMPPSRLGQK
jgi:polyisoprenoid-binding protein YceI